MMPTRPSIFEVASSSGGVAGENGVWRGRRARKVRGTLGLILIDDVAPLVSGVSWFRRSWQKDRQGVDRADGLSPKKIGRKVGAIPSTKVPWY